MFPYKAVFTTLLRILSVLPLVVLHKIAVFFAFFLYFTPNRLRATTLTNLNLCFPERSNNDILKLTKLSLIETSKAFNHKFISLYFQVLHNFLLHKNDDIKGI